MNISPHLLIDAVILSAALTITLVLRAKGIAARKEKENTWLFKKKKKILWVNICTHNLEGVAISINKWWKTRYPAYKIRVVSKKEFELIKKQAKKKEQ